MGMPVSGIKFELWEIKSPGELAATAYRSMADSYEQSRYLYVLRGVLDLSESRCRPVMPSVLLLPYWWCAAWCTKSLLLQVLFIVIFQGFLLSVCSTAGPKS